SCCRDQGNLHYLHICVQLMFGLTNRKDGDYYNGNSVEGLVPAEMIRALGSGSLFILCLG
ncbi:MAG: hypothetical protein ACI4ET_02720, partial [Bilifractor sp.]